MSQALSFDELQRLVSLSADQRYDYLLQQAVEQQQLWILTGDGGSVLLNHGGQDCVPVWPHEELAEQHIHGDWSDCQSRAIPLGDWQARWTSGLREDGFSVVGFIDDQEEGVVVSAEEFDDDLLTALQGDD